MQKKRAFTLTEMLVIVVVVALLAWIAVPQYQIAVNKSRYTALIPLAKSVKKAEELAYMSNGHYSDELDHLHVSVPGQPSGNKIVNTNGTTIEVATGSHAYVKAIKDNLDNTYVMYFSRSQNFPNEIHCEALKGNARAKQLCLSLTNNETPIAGTDANYDAYILEGEGSGLWTWTDNTSAGHSAVPFASFVWDQSDIVRWECDKGKCNGYDKNNHRIAYRYCAGDCPEGGVYLSWSDYINDEYGRPISTRNCLSFTPDRKSCKMYNRFDFVYDEEHGRFFWNCGNAGTNGDCAAYEVMYRESDQKWCYEITGTTCTGEWGPAR